MSEFQREIENIIKKSRLDITYQDIYRELESKYESDELSTTVLSEDILKTFLKDINSIVVIGLSGYIRPLIKYIKKNVEFIEIYDDFFDGDSFEGIKVSKNKKLFRSDDVDCFFITPRDINVKNKFLKEIRCEEKVFWSIDVIRKINKPFQNKKNDYKKCEEILSNIEKASNPIIFFGGFYSNNFSPMFLELEQKGFTPFYIVRSNFLAMTLDTLDKVYENVYKINLEQMIYLASRFSPTTKLIINWDSFRSNNFCGFRAVCTMVYVISLLKMIQAQKILIQYDPISIIYSDYQYSNDIMKLLGQMLNSADKIVYNSSTYEMLEYQANIYNLEKPMINFYRYNKKFEKPMPKRSLEEFHILMVGVFLDNTADPMRSGMREYIKNILDKSIHLHYLSYIENDFMLENFISSLSEKQKQHFHVEKNIVDQVEMIEFISQFHAGWMLHNTANMCNAISKLENQTYKDMLYVFLSATVTSSVLAHGSAGLPIFINRSMQGIIKEFPNEFFIPIELSETINIDKIIEKQEWQKRYDFCYENRGLFAIEDNINRLITFLDE